MPYSDTPAKCKPDVTSSPLLCVIFLIFRCYHSLWAVCPSVWPGRSRLHSRPRSVESVRWGGSSRWASTPSAAYCCLGTPKRKPPGTGGFFVESPSGGACVSNVPPNGFAHPFVCSHSLHHYLATMLVLKRTGVQAVFERNPTIHCRHRWAETLYAPMSEKAPPDDLHLAVTRV